MVQLALQKATGARDGEVVHQGASAARRASEHPILRGPGLPVPSGTRQLMEHSLGGDYSAVRVYQGTYVDRVGALAYTEGDSIHVSPTHFRPGTADGDRLLRHELVHVAQQRAGRVRATEPGRAGAAVVDDARLEAEADAWASRATNWEKLAGREVAGSTGSPSSGVIQRQPADPKTKPIPPPTPKRDDPKRAEKQLDDTLEAVSHQYQLLVLKQRDGVDHIKGGAERSKEPTAILLDVLGAVAEFALGAVAAGVGSAIAQRVEANVIAALAKAAASGGGAGLDAALAAAKRGLDPAKLVADVMKETSKNAVKDGVKLVKDKASGPTAMPPIAAYFEGIRDHYTNLASKTESEFDTKGKQPIRDSPEPQIRAQGLLDSVLQEFDNTKQLAEKETLKGWLSYLAQSTLGSVQEGGGPVVERVEQPADLYTVLWEPKVKGLLYLGTDDSSDANIKSARLAGADPVLRTPLGGSKIEDLSIPFTMRSKMYTILADEHGILAGLDRMRSHMSWLGGLARNQQLGGEHPGLYMAYDGAQTLIDKVRGYPLPAVED
jgi:hypothetical protein